MKRFLILFVTLSTLVFSSCEGPEGPPGEDGLIAEVFEIKNVNFTLDPVEGYIIYQKLNPQIFASDVILIYRLVGTINSTTPIWQSIPRTLYPAQGELDYDFDFSKEDFTIYAGGTYNLALTPQFITNQTFRIVIVPGAFSKTVDTSDYFAVIKALNIKENQVKTIKL